MTWRAPYDDPVREPFEHHDVCAFWSYEECTLVIHYDAYDFQSQEFTLMIHCDAHDSQSRECTLVIHYDAYDSQSL